MFSKSNKFKNKQTSKSKSEVDGTTGSSDEDDVYELLVEDGNKYRDAMLYFVGELIKDRKSKTLFRLKTANTKGAIIFYFRRDNLYLIGFEIVGGSKYEFGCEGDTHFIEGSIFLGYGGSYRDLEEVLLVGIKIGYWALVETVNNLAEGKGRNDVTSWMNEIKKYLATAVVMIPESGRFKWVFVTLVRLMELGAACRSAHVEPWMPSMIHGWEAMSKIAADMSKIAVVGSEDDTEPPVEENHLYTEEDVTKALKLCIWAADALVVHCLFKVPKQTLKRKRIREEWWVSVKLADTVGNEAIVWEEWSNFKKRFPNYDDGFEYV